MLSPAIPQVNVLLLVMAFAGLIASQPRCGNAEDVYDVVIYGGTSAGVVAAVQSARLGKSVVLIEPGSHLGGMTSGGLGATDIGNKSAIGGISREFYRRVFQHYANDGAWLHESRDEYLTKSPRQVDDSMWTFEPHVAESIFRGMLDETEALVVFGERLDLIHGVEKRRTRIVSISMESGRKFAGKVFIDATYEGDLMARAGVSYAIGREANAEYHETLNGVQKRRAVHHQFSVAVDPYVVPGDPSSGLLWGIQHGLPGEDGSRDLGVQAYCFRMCQTDVEENRIEWRMPTGYDETQYELLLRNFEAGDDRLPLHLVMMPNRKTDTNNNHAFSTDHIGHNYDWPEGNYATRDRILRDHLHYQQGLMWTLAKHPRVPQRIRETVSSWGLCRDEFTDTGGWPHQLYVREARRMVSDYVMTQHHCQRRMVAEHPVGLAAYTMDSHNVHRYAVDGRVYNEGDVQVGGLSPYPIAYESIVPNKSECTNLFVPVCLSASHIAYGSIRMEPVFMVLGHSAATAASLAIDYDAPVQRVPYEKIRERLLHDGQVLNWVD